jgi:hypothetical protein
MPWDSIAQHAPAFAALCFIVVIFMKAMGKYVTQVGELSNTCHISHREVAEIAARAIEANTSILKEVRDAQQKTTLVMREVTTLLRSANGRDKRG